MKKIKFGFSQLIKSTPVIVKRFRDAIIYAVAAALPFAHEIADWLSLTLEKYAMFSGLVIIAVKAIATFFGVTDEQKPPYTAPNDATTK